ncbi:MAG: ATP-dependent DNA helicase RecG [Flavobacteriaceae bacterium]|nr:ATP-dependent DNA helicase RecG [Flavobacteriaceae bacterium]|tara:strand:- start:5320 stop:7425 length:2106 start_codon:yes stop_codon:yes gene_type:complete
MKNDILNTSIEFLKGVGPNRAKLIKSELKILTFRDLLFQFPFKYIDKTSYHKISEIRSLKTEVQIIGSISDLKEIGIGNKKRIVAKFFDSTGTIELIWFKSSKWLIDSIKLNTKYIAFGKINIFKGKYSIAHPELELYDDLKLQQRTKLNAVYPSTELLNKRGINNKVICSLIEELLISVNNKIEENLPEYIIKKFKLLKRRESLIIIHKPRSITELKKAIYRLKFEEIFYLQIRLIKRNISRKEKIKGYTFNVIGDKFEDFFKNHLTFKLTSAQKSVLKEIRKDLGSGAQMNRLLQGDVGSGKTIVAFMSALIAIGNGFQACIMTPTEILSYQHYNKFNEICKLLNINMKVLTGSSKTKYKKELKLSLIEGDIDLLIGTHAIIYDGIVFKNLGIAIIDEQHKFGVAQRSKLWHKNNLPPHILIMTATPIPRTLAMSVYGDLDMSIINELPPGRKHINTIHQTNKDRLKLIDFVKLQISKGRQIYVVYPLIKESEKLDFKDLIDGYESFSRDFPMPDYQISIVHGKMKNEDKDYEMKRFIENKTQILVSTTVIEVGVDIPNATVMIIESAERFGLSQLHQLRGRVGRGSHNSYCFLITGDKRTKESKIRMKTMVSTNDGFIIAEKDLELRGPGNIIGTQQSGEMPLRITNLVADSQLIHKIRLLVMKILEKDPDLINVNNKIINNYLKLIINKKNIWEYIS